MNEPRRWRDDPGAAPEGAGDLLAIARRSSPMTPEVRARTAARVRKLAAIPVAASVAVLWAKGLAVAAVVGVAGYVALQSGGVLRTPVGPSSPAARSVTRRPATRPAAVPAPSLLRVSPVAPAATPAPAAAPVPVPAPVIIPSPVTPSLRPSTPAGNTPPTPTPAPTPAPVEAASAVPTPSLSTPHVSPTDTSRLEDDLLEPARSALSRNPQESLDRLAVYDATFRTPRLAVERDYIAFEALRRLGRRADARTRGEAFLARYPRSIYSETVRAALASIR